MAVEYKDYYKTLGVERGASETDIRRAFRKLAREYHPDVARDKRRAEEKFKEINEAYEVLGDPEKRRKYDSFGPEAFSGGGFRPPPGGQQTKFSRRRGPARGFEFQFGGTGFSEFFEHLFGGGMRRPRPTDLWSEDAAEMAEEIRDRGRDVQGDLLVSLREVLEGSVRSISLQRRHPATGRTETKTLRVRIPAGVREGQTIRAPGQGEPGSGGAGDGDLLLRVRLAKHPEFRVEAADLYYELELAPWEAVLGTTVAVPTLEGSTSVRVPAGTSPGQKLRLRQRGLPVGKDLRGDLYVVVAIQIPKGLGAEEKALWEELARKSRFNPRAHASDA